MNKIAILILTAVLTSSVNNMFSQCISCSGSTTGSYANAMGQNNSALGSYSSAMGLSNQITNGATSAIALGSYNNLTGGHAVAIGRRLSATGTASMVIGYADEGYTLTNTFGSSLMIGFRSNLPTFFVGCSNGVGTTGSVGIGNTGLPQAKLHLKADEGEIAAMFIQPYLWDDGSLPGGGGIDIKGVTSPGALGAYLLLGNELHGIGAKRNTGLIFSTESFYVFNDGFLKIGKDARAGSVLACTDSYGTAKWVDPAAYALWSVNENKDIYRMSKVGILNEKPETELDVNGTVRMSGFMLQNQETQIGRVLSCSAITGDATWVDPANFSIWHVNDHGEAYRMSKIGIGTNEPKSELDVNGNISVNDAIIGKVGPSKWVDPDFLTLLGSENEYASKIMIPKGNNP